MARARAHREKQADQPDSTPKAEVRQSVTGVEELQLHQPAHEAAHVHSIVPAEPLTARTPSRRQRSRFHSATDAVIELVADIRASVASSDSGLLVRLSEKAESEMDHLRRTSERLAGFEDF